MTYYRKQNCSICKQRWKSYYFGAANFFFETSLNLHYTLHRAVMLLSERHGEDIADKSIYLLLEISRDNKPSEMQSLYKLYTPPTSIKYVKRLVESGYVCRHVGGWIITIKGRTLLSELEEIILSLYNEESGAKFPDPGSDLPPEPGSVDML